MCLMCHYPPIPFLIFHPSPFSVFSNLKPIFRSKTYRKVETSSLFKEPEVLLNPNQRRFRGRIKEEEFFFSKVSVDHVRFIFEIFDLLNSKCRFPNNEENRLGDNQTKREKWIQQEPNFRSIFNENQRREISWIFEISEILRRKQVTNTETKAETNPKLIPGTNHETNPIPYSL